MDCLNESFESPEMVKVGCPSCPCIESEARSHTKKEVLSTEGS
jgi:hypothetical protein